MSWDIHWMSWNENSNRSNGTLIAMSWNEDSNRCANGTFIGWVEMRIPIDPMGHSLQWVEMRIPIYVPMDIHWMSWIEDSKRCVNGTLTGWVEMRFLIDVPMGH